MASDGEMSSPLTGFACRTEQESLVFGQLPDGTVAHISGVPSGLECNCVCPACQTPLVARKGRKNKYHFGHYGVIGGRPCATGPETALHKFAKDLLARRLSLVLPRLELASDDGLWKGHSGGEFSFDAAVLESSLGEIVPDVIIRKGGRDLLIEFVVTHKCDAAKITKIRKLDLAAIEIDLSGLPRDISGEDIEEAIIAKAPREWLHNPKLRVGENYLRQQRLERERELAKRAAVLERERQQQERAIYERITALGEAYTLACTTVRLMRSKLGTSTDLIALGLAQAVGIEVPGFGCFTVSPRDWQAALLLSAVKYATPGTAPIMGRQRAWQTMRRRGWLNSAFTDLTNIEVMAIRAYDAAFERPENAIEAWAEELSRRGIFYPTTKGYGWVLHTEAIGRACEAAREARNRRETVENRLSQAKGFVRNVLRNVPERELAGFSFDRWVRTPLPGRDYSVLEAVHSDERWYRLTEDFLRLWRGPAACTDLMGLPLSKAVARYLTTKWSGGQD